MKRVGSARKTLVAAMAMVFALFVIVWAHQLETSAAIGFSDSTPNAGDVVTITGTLTYTGGTNSANCGGPGCPHPVPSAGTAVVGEVLKIQIKQSDILGGYNPALGVACADVGAFVDVPAGVGESETTNSSGQVTRSFDTTGLGGLTICFKSHAPAGGGGHGSTQASSGEVALVITDSCTGVTLTNPAVAGGSTNPNGSVKGPWMVAMDVTNCTGSNLDFKVQGGANSWAPYNGIIQVSEGSFAFKNNKKNTVITWDVTVADGDTETIVFGVGSTQSVVPCGEVTLPLSGPWSAAYIDPVTGLPTRAPADADSHTERAQVTSVECTP